MKTHKQIEKALKEVNSPFNKWEIKYCENEHSSWFEAATDGAFFSRAHLDDLVQVCLILSGLRKI